MKAEYICIWDKNKEKTWSGVTHALYSALSKKMEVQDAGFGLSYFEKKLIKILSISFVGGRLTFRNSLNYMATIIPHIHARTNPILDSDVQVQVGDITNLKGKYYIYQDLSVDSLIYIKNNMPTAFQYCNYQHVTRLSFKLRSKWQNNIYKNAGGIFTMSKWLADNLITYSGISSNKVHHVGGGININPIAIDQKEKMNNKVLFIGRAFERKAGPLVCDAFKILRTKYLKDAELYIVGPAENPLSEVIEGVKYLGDIGSDELTAYFNKCDIFCMPSHFEAYGLVFIEALASGLPCIGRNEFAMKEFIQDGFNGYLLANNNPEELALKMFDLLTNQTIKNNVREKNEEYISKYTWDAVAGRILRIIENDC